MYEFSIPMLYSNPLIDEVLRINKSVEKSKITSCFGALGQDTEEAMGWENYRDHPALVDGKVTIIQTIDEMAPFVKRMQENGITFQYCLNSTKTMTAEDLYAARPRIFRLCDSLLRNGITHLKVSTLILFDFIQGYYGDAFTYYLSTTREYSSIDQYGKLLDMNPLIKEVCLPSDLNKDFMFIQTFLERFPNVELEAMVNEGCMYACPWRKDHTPHSSGTHTSALRHKITSGESDMPERMITYYTKMCNTCRIDNPYVEFYKRRSLQPYEIGNYSQLTGLTKFKYAGRDIDTGYLLDSLKNYLIGIEDISAIEHLPWNYFNNYSYNGRMNNVYTIGDLIKDRLVEDLEYYRIHGHECHAKCGIRCRRCYGMAERLQQKVSEYEK